MKDAPIEFRTKTEEPTETGWYYARPSALIAGSLIAPTFARRHLGGAMTVYLPAEEQQPPVSAFDWFGPVHAVREG